MSAVSCPFKPVAQREMAVGPHEHRFLAHVRVSDGTVLMDCGCGYRQRVRMGAHGETVQLFEDGLVPGGSSVDNAIFSRRDDGQFIDRWTVKT